MKKQTLNINCRTGIHQVSGELFSGNGVTVFIHKDSSSPSWCISEFSTGFRVSCSGDYSPAMQATMGKGKAGAVVVANAIINNPDWCKKIAYARDYNLSHGGKVVNEKGDLA